MPKRTLEGTVVSDKQDKTVVVRVERRFTHPVMKKTVRRSKTYHAHDEKNEFNVGDVVRISEHSPISKMKRWLVIEGDKKGGRGIDRPEENEGHVSRKAKAAPDAAAKSESNAKSEPNVKSESNAKSDQNAEDEKKSKTEEKAK